MTATIREATDADWPRIRPFVDATVRSGTSYAFPLDLTPETGRGVGHPTDGYVGLHVMHLDLT